VIDNTSAAVFDGEADCPPAGAPVLRKSYARWLKKHQTRDHAAGPSERPLAWQTGPGTANSVDWRNSSRAMLYSLGG